MTKSVFISYASDDTPAAEKVRNGLEYSGIDCWMAPRDIVPGKEYAEQIIDAIDTCSVMVVVVSDASNVSRFVHNEVERAASKDKVIIPLRIQGVTLSRSLEFFISSAQWIDAMADVDDAVPRLTWAIRHHQIATPDDLHQADPHSQQNQLQHNLPDPTTPFVGRERELIALAEMLADPTLRLITVVGAGGMGKTRLAIESARGYLNHYQSNVYFVPLAPLTAVDEIEVAIASVVGYTFQTDRRSPTQQLLDFLRNREMLLLLDNFEHLIDGAIVVSEILQAAPRVRVLVTTRERLRLSGEKIYILEGMESPNQELAAEIDGYDTVRLFLQSARLSQPGFQLQPDDRVHLVRICGLLQGMPLGILMAAAWVELLSLEEISHEISRNLDFLETDLRDIPERQRSMRAVFNYSWQLLGKAEQVALASLSIFQGSLNHRAASDICETSLRDLATLINKSLLHATADGRYEVHQLVRQYAAEILSQEPVQRDALSDRHAEYYLTLIQAQMSNLASSHQPTALAELARDIENVRAAWTWAVQRGQMALVRGSLNGLSRFYELQGWFSDGEAVSRAAAELASSIQDPGTEFDALVRQASFCRTLGKREQAEALLNQSAAMLGNLESVEADLQWKKADLLLGYARLARDDGDGPAATRHYAETAKIYESLGDELATARALRELSYVLRNLEGIESFAERQQQLVEAEEAARRSVAICRRTGDEVGLAESLLQLGISLSYLSQSDAAKQALQESRLIFEKLNIERGIVLIQCQFGAPEFALGHLAEARAQNYPALAFAQKHGDLQLAVRIHIHLGVIDLYEGAYESARRHFHQSLKAGGNIGEQHHTALGLCYLGYAERGLGNSAAARNRVVEGMRLGIAIRGWWALTIGVALSALLLAGQGAITRAIELYSLAMLNSHLEASLERLVGRFLKEAVAVVPSDIAVAAQERGKTLNLWITAHELLSELEGPVTHQ